MAQKDNVVKAVDDAAQVVTVAQVPGSELTFRKSNEAIGLRVVEGKLTLLNRKVFNVLVFHAQQIKNLGENAPIDTPSSKKYFWVPLSQLARDASYGSNDTKFLKQQISEMQDIKLLLETDRQWTSERLIASVTFVNPKGLNSRAGQVWVGFAFPPEVHETVMQPGTYTRLNVYYQGLLKSGSALALYEVCRRYATNPSKLTYIETYEHWFGVLTGSPVPETADGLPEYKYFKRDVINRAIAEVKKSTDISVTLIEHKKGKRVHSLQFSVEFNKPPEVEGGEPPVIDVQLLERIMALGLKQDDAANDLATYPEAKIRQALDVVDARLKAKNAPPIDSKAAYFRWALKSGARAPAAKTAPPAAAVGHDGPSLLEKFRVARAKLAFDLYNEMEDKERGEVYDRFRAQAKIKVAARDKVASHTLTRSALSQWYAHELWGEPSALDLSTFADSSEISFNGAGESADQE